MPYRWLESFYGIAAGSPTFKRTTIGVGLRNEARLELYPTFITLLYVAPNGDISDRKETEPFSGQSSLEKVSHIRLLHSCLPCLYGMCIRM
jgi:hypothetical protein